MSTPSLKDLYAEATKPMSQDEATKLAADVKKYQPKITAARNEIKKEIFGQDEMVDTTLMAIFAGGNTLLEGMPGLAKTLFSNTLSAVLGLANDRVQCTPDLMPNNILGTEVLETDDKGQKSFRTVYGPIVTQQLLVDEINRASERTQSALLQAMQEKQITIGGNTTDLPAPFYVIATQNPVEQKGTNPLPEAQLDRFIVKVVINYPSREAEKLIAIDEAPEFKHRTIEDVMEDERKRAQDEEVPRYKSGNAVQMLESNQITEIQNIVKKIGHPEPVVDFVADLVRATRPGEEGSLVDEKEIVFGAGPRASQSLIRMAKARAMMDGRLQISIDDVKAVAHSVLEHRMKLKNAYSAARPLSEIIDGIIDTLESRRNAAPKTEAAPAPSV